MIKKTFLFILSLTTTMSYAQPQKANTTKSVPKETTVVDTKAGTLPSSVLYLSPNEMSDHNMVTKTVITSGQIAEIFVRSSTQHFINLDAAFPKNKVSVSFNPKTYKGNSQRFGQSVGKRFIFWGKVEEFEDNYGVKRLGFFINSDEQVIEIK
jgi:hypothetical protein